MENEKKVSRVCLVLLGFILIGVLPLPAIVVDILTALNLSLAILILSAAAKIAVKKTAMGKGALIIT